MKFSKLPSLGALLTAICFAGAGCANGKLPKGPAWTTIYKDDFSRGMARWKPTDPGAWTLEDIGGGGTALTLSKKLSDYDPRYRSPHNIALLQGYETGDFEFTVRDITFFDKAGERWDENESGALVEDVVAGGWANLGALYVGDLLQQIDGRGVRNVEDLEAVMKEVAAEAPASLVFQVLRGIYTVYLEFEPKWDDVRPD